MREEALKLLVLTASYPTPEEPVGGIFVREYARAAAEDAEVAVVHLDRDGGRGIRIERLAEDDLPVLRVRHGGGKLAQASQLLAARAAWNALPFEPDVIHAHFFVAGVPAVVLGRLHRKPVVISEHWGMFLPENPARLSLRVRAATRFSLGHADLVLPVSDALLRALRAHGVRRPMRVLRNVVDTDVFHPGGEPEPGLLLAAGLFYAEKGFELLLDALPTVLAARPDVRLELVGDGELRPLLERQAAGLPVTFHGRLPKPELAKLMRRAQLLVMPSRLESSGVVALEALASGLPVVATAVGALPEAVTEGSGVLARPEELADGVLRGLETSFDRGAIAAAARARYGREAIRGQLTEIYAGLLK